MSPKNTKMLFDHFPRLYAELDYFECDDAWFNIIYKLSEDICALVCADYEPDDLCFEGLDGFYPIATQVKEKFGSLRFYACGLSKDMRKLIEVAEAESI